MNQNEATPDSLPGAAEGDTSGATAPQAPASTEDVTSEAVETPTITLSNNLANGVVPESLIDPGTVVGELSTGDGGGTLSWQQRLVFEREDLQAKVNRLGTFLANPVDVHPNDLHLLYEQRRAMEKYLEILNIRIQRLAVSA